MRKLANSGSVGIGGGTAPSTTILKHGDDDIFVKNPIFLVFENELQACTTTPPLRTIQRTVPRYRRKAGLREGKDVQVRTIEDQLEEASASAEPVLNEARSQLNHEAGDAHQEQRVVCG